MSTNAPGSMQLLRLSLARPEENLALDEALLLRAESAMSSAPQGLGSSCEVLRFWESPVHFVVLGVASKLEDDVDEDACRLAGVPVVRRASGGGTVLQGPGCLNFSLVLSLKEHPELIDLRKSYEEILGRVAKALGVDGCELRGTSDLAVGEMKLSGNAQKRTRHALLHHGTILYGLDMSVLSRCLKEPEKQPGYRERRPHAAFVRNLPASRGEIELRIASAWNASPSAAPLELPDLRELIREKYGNPEWTRRF